MKSETYFWVALGLIGLVAIAYVVATSMQEKNGEGEPAPEPVACTLEAMICPDGSAVGRTGPNCEFAPCPGPLTQ